MNQHTAQGIGIEVWAAGPQETGVSSHDDHTASWVAVRVGQVLTYADDMDAARSIHRIWALADQQLSHLPEPNPVRQPVHQPGIVTRVAGYQSVDRATFPYRGRAGAGHIAIGGILWRPLDRAALRSITAAWEQAAAIAEVVLRRR